MREVISYTLILTPQGNGQVIFRLAGEAQRRATPALSAQDFTALAILLAQKNLAYDIQRNRFISSDTNDVFVSAAHLA